MRRNQAPSKVSQTSSSTAVKKPIPVKKPHETYIKTHLKELLYVSSAIVGLLCTADAYLYSGKDASIQRNQQWEIVQELNNTDKKIVNLIRDLNTKVESNSNAIYNIQAELKLIENQIHSLKFEESDSVSLS
jgi:TolA-binding protein